MTEKGKSVIRSIYRQLGNIDYGEVTDDFEADNMVQDIHASVTLLQSFIVREMEKFNEPGED